MRCTAKAKQRQEQCRLPVVPGMTVCRFHGGRTPRGPALPQFKTGKYSKLLPSRLLARYREAERDPELLSLHSELALIDARLVDLLKRVDTGESGALWATLKKEYEEFRLHRAAGDIPKMHVSIARLDALMDRAVQDHSAWQEIGEKIEQRRKLAMSETQRLIGLRQMLTCEQAMLLAGVIVDIVTRHVPDKQALSHIVADLQQVMQGGEATYELADSD
jgi:hypothetical protein